MSETLKLRVVPLGGLGHVGGNMMAYETDEDLVVVDCGVLFPTAEQPGVDYVIPDITYLLERRAKLRAFVITHGHEDHIGALPFVLPQLNVPVYGTRLTLALAAARIAEYPDLNADLRVLVDRQPVRIGSFAIEAVPVTHSIPDAVCLAIRTPAGTVVHTGDFKIDVDPVDGRLTDLEALRRLGDEGVVALLSDSTNAEKGGHTWGEREVARALDEQIGSAPGRVVVTAFSSNMHRLQSVIDASERAKRRVIPIGRSMQQNVQLGMERGTIRCRYGAIADPEDFDKLAAARVTVLAAGSQGEALSAMSRIAAGQHGHIRLDPGDRVIMSARRIPGNERAVGTLVNSLLRLGVEVVDDRFAKVHASGHAFNDEQRQMIELCRPRFFIPIHGEYRHLVRHAGLAEAAGVRPQDICVVEDGQPLEIESTPEGLRLRRVEPVTAGHVFVDGKGVGDVGEIVLRDRRMLAETGMVLCVVILTEEGRILAGPEIASRGVLHPDASALIDGAAGEVRAAIERHSYRDVPECSEEVRLALRRFFRRELDRRPLIVPVVMMV